MWGLAVLLNFAAVEWEVGGYTQARFEAVEGRERQFFIRRCRVELEAKAKDGAELEVEVEVGKGKVSLKDAYIQFGVGRGTWLRVGQFKWHGSYECLRSSSMLALLERSKVVREFFPGEHDRGIVIGGRTGGGSLFWELGLWNGNGTRASDEAKIYGDSNRAKDISLRLSNYPKVKYFGPAPKSFWQAAVQWGKARNAGAGKDERRRRLSVAFQHYFEPVPEKRVYKDTEGSSLKAEVLWGRGYGLDGVPGKWHGKKAFGFYIELCKNIVPEGKPCRNALALRADYWRPEGREGKWTWAFGWHHYVGPQTMLSLVYESPEGGSSVLRGQCQYKF